jgi:hypothetical protein
MQQSAVDDTVHTTRSECPDARGDVVSATHNFISAESSDKFLIGLRCVRYDREPIGLRQLNRIASQGTGGAGHRHRIWNPEVVEGETSREGVHQEG